MYDKNKIECKKCITYLEYLCDALYGMFESEKNIFRINQYIILKLENGKTNIYVAGDLFNQCKYILLNLRKEDIPDYDEINDMDEAIELYTKKQMKELVKKGNHEREDLDNFNRKHEKKVDELTPETAFFGHCSNLQVWVENGYNLNILHSSLSFPLLKKLVDIGDKKAIIALKEEIIDRIQDGYDDKVITYFLNEKYLDLFTEDEIILLFENVTDNRIVSNLKKQIYTKEIINASTIEVLDDLFEKINNEDLLRLINKKKNDIRIREGLRNLGVVKHKVLG